MEFPEIKSRVAAGIEWLDAKKPGWVNEIDLDELDIIICWKCILGQLFGDFSRWPRLELTLNQLFEFGFDAPVNKPVQTRAYYAELEDEWRRSIEERLEAEHAT